MASSAATVAVPASVGEATDRTRWFILLGLITAAIMEVLDTTIINVALPQMAGNLSATREEVAWVSTSYILANVVVLPMTAFFTETFGRKRYLTFSILLFVVSSMLCGTATSLGMLVVWRLIQGAGGAALLSTAQATLRQVFPRSEQGLVQAIFLLGVIVAPTLGPTLGGYITDNASWHWCFFINLPIGLISAFLVVTFLHDPPGHQRRTGPVDWLGITLLIIGVGSLQYVLEEGNILDWYSSKRILYLSIISGIALSVLVWWQLSSRNSHPVIQFRVLKNRDLLASILLFVVLGFGLYGGVIIFPLFTQTILGFSPTETGLAMMPGGIATAILAVVCGRLLNGERPMADPRFLVLGGMALMLLAMWTLGHLSTAAGEADARYALIIRGAALGLLFTPINNVAFGSLKPQEAQQASGLINLARQLGGSFGIAALGAYLTRHIAYHRADLVQHLYPGSAAFQARFDPLVATLTSQGAALADAQQRALAILDGTMMRQASMLAYNDAWLLLLASFVCVIPAVFLLRKPGSRAAAAMAAEGH
ncbi:MAG TPA: DHA2 family efflux MFS transporter permease subunit [Vicinamibacterales bacterium]|jgi:DHA2 family multidrug resistance protein|nr:DHA2 family efflux MFS transporter permease subunit [Vicinamibacterales bacterium]